MKAIHVDNDRDLMSTPGSILKKDGVWFGHVPHAADADGNFIAGLAGHGVTEHEDGTITVAPSILLRQGDGSGGWRETWHGFLERGEWRSC